MDLQERIYVETGGHLFVELLKNKGVQFVFGTTGAGMPDIQDAMVVVKPPKWIQDLHEFVSVSAAIGYSLASEKVGVALIDRIVGTLNCAGAFYAAFLSSAPIVVFASSNIAGIPIPNGLPEYHYHSDPAYPIRPWIKWCTQVNSLEMLPDDINKAFLMASVEHTGPVFVALRQDLMAQRIGKVYHLDRHTETYSSRIPDDLSLNKIVDLVVTSEFVQLFTSQLGRHPASVEALKRFAHTFGVAVSEARFFMNYPITDPLHVGFFDGYGTPLLFPSTKLVLSVEMGLLPPYKFENDVKVIELSSDPKKTQDVAGGGDYGSSYILASMRCICDMAPTLEKLVKIGSERLASSDKSVIKERTAKISEYHERLLKSWDEKAKKSFDAGVLDGWSIGYILNKHWSKEKVMVDGSMSYWDSLIKTVKIEKPGTYFGNPAAFLGITPGMAYGVALADREYIEVKDYGLYKAGKISQSKRTVVAILGDGDAAMGNIVSALWSCKHYGINLLYIVLNNACWGIDWPPIEDSLTGWSKKAGDFETVDIDQPRINFAEIAHTLEVWSKHVSTVDEFDLALQEALKVVNKGETALLEVFLPKPTGQKPSVVP